MEESSTRVHGLKEAEGRGLGTKFITTKCGKSWWATEGICSAIGQHLETADGRRMGSYVVSFDIDTLCANASAM